jgi:hypothetical protein
MPFHAHSLSRFRGDLLISLIGNFVGTQIQTDHHPKSLENQRHNPLACPDASGAAQCAGVVNPAMRYIGLEKIVRHLRRDHDSERALPQMGSENSRWEKLAQNCW